MKKGVYENAHLSATVPRMRDTASSLVVYGFHIAHRLQDKGNILRYNLSSNSKYNKNNDKQIFLAMWTKIFGDVVRWFSAGVPGSNTAYLRTTRTYF